MGQYLADRSLGCAECGRLQKNHSGTLEVYGLHMCNRRSTPPQDAQKDRPARPQRVKDRCVPSGYVEGLNDVRTLLADFSASC